MPSTSEACQQLVSLFTTRPCWTIQPLAEELDYSIPSVRRFLGEIGYHSSFTHNGCCYTLRSIPRFDRDGLWFYDEIGFSRAGSLTKTLIDLTHRSATGMSAQQLGVKLQCRCHSILVHLCREGRLQREKVGRSHIYLSVDSQRASTQRRAMTAQSTPGVQLPAEIAVLVLVEFIRNPGLSFAQLAAAISRRNHVTLDMAQIEGLFDLYGLKKTIRTAGPTLCGR